MNWKKNDTFQVKIEDMSDAGEGIGKTDGYTWFIKDAVTGDTVEALVMKTKKSYGFARLLRVLEPSPHRVTPRCPVARQCGGCQLQALDYEEQLRFKEKKICNNLRRIGGVEGLTLVDEDGRPRDGGTAEVEIAAALPAEAAPGANAAVPVPERRVPIYPIIGMEDPWRYRNKAQFPFGRDKDGKIVTGFYAGRTHAIIAHEDCLLGVEENQPILDCVKTYMNEFAIAPYDEESHTGLVRHVLIRKGFRTGELMVCLVINGKAEALKSLDVLVERLRGLYPGAVGVAAAPSETKRRCTGGESAEFTAAPVMTSISCSINRERTNVIMGTEVVNLWGPGYITDYIGQVQYRISPLSFYQVNPIQTERLYRTALDYAGLTGNEVVWDLYCGIGTISLFLAQRAKKVYGVEIVPQAIEDARANARLNNIENVEFFVGKAEEVLPDLYEKEHIHADVIVVDPPRKGCDEKCLETIVKMQPARVVYVSCDSATLARDVKWLATRGYELRRGRGCDMFAGGGHVETVALLVRKP